MVSVPVSSAEVVLLFLCTSTAGLAAGFLSSGLLGGHGALTGLVFGGVALRVGPSEASAKLLLDSFHWAPRVVLLGVGLPAPHVL